MNTIKIKFGKEEIVSRTPSLFPYMEFDGNGVCHKHYATDSENGCYGKIVCSIKTPVNVNLVVRDENGCIMTPIEGGNTYSYSTLMWYYKKYKNNTEESDTFIDFMEYGIGKFYIDADIDWDVCDLVPEYIYLSEAARIYDEYVKMSVMVEQYTDYKELTGELNCELECLEDKYKRMGGDVMRDYYKEMIVESEKRAVILHDLGDIDDLGIHMNLCFVSTDNDLGCVSTYINNWKPGHPYYNGDFVTYNDRTYKCTCTDKNGTIGIWDTVTETYVFDKDNFELMSEEIGSSDDGDIEIEGTSDSKLVGFRKHRSYLNMAGDIEQPSHGTDWLYYYKIGSLGHYETETDGVGNITIQDGYTRNTEIGAYEEHLMAYGDIITNITCDAENRTVTIEYVIGANLKAKLTKTIDDEENIVYCYDGYEYNENDKHGVFYSETYQYGEDSDVNILNDGGVFDMYVSTHNPGAEYAFVKGVFDTTSTQANITTFVNGMPVTYQANTSRFRAKSENTTDSLMAPIIRDDYLVGINCGPYVNGEVFVSRGNAAAWERHMKLGEVKSFADLENYSNGGFFNII